MIKLSVIVLIYNMEELLPRCLASLERQTMDGIQYILVDDGSEDHSGQICDEWKPERHTVKVIHKENAGVVAGWMDGVNAADGEYVGFVDSDDYVDDDMFENLWTPVAENKVDVSMCNHLYECNGELQPCKVIIKEGIYTGGKMNDIRYQVLPKLAEPYLSPSLCNKIFRKDLFKSNFQFCNTQVTIADDVSIVLPTLFAASSFSYLNKPYYHYVTRENSTTYTYKENMYFQHAQLLDNLKKAFEFYHPMLPDGAFEMIVSAMGNQWLRMITKTKIPKEQRKKLLYNFYRDQRYVDAAKKNRNQRLNKWAKAYCGVVLNQTVTKYVVMIKLLQVKHRVLNYVTKCKLRSGK